MNDNPTKEVREAYLERLHKIWDEIDDLAYDITNDVFPGVTYLTFIRDLRKEVAHALSNYDHGIETFFKEYR